MEDRVRALETELSTLKTTLNTSKWWLGILGAFLIGGLGVTNYFTIPSAINSAFKEKGGQGLIDKLTISEQSAAESSGRLKTAADNIGDMEPITMYKCPSDPLSAADWANFGCLGQYSSISTCVDYKSVKGDIEKQCDPVVLFKKK